MADAAKTRLEITTDPLTRGYSEMTDAEVVISVHTKNRERILSSLTATQVLNAIDITEWNALTDAQRQTIWDVLHIGDINPFGVEATIFIAVFGGGSATITSLAAIRKETISRATEIGLGNVTEGHVQRARA